MHSSPRGRQAARILSGAFAQRPTSSGPVLHMPEQHDAPVLHRSCSGWQPGARTHRPGPSAEGSQRPEQQSLLFAQSASAGRHPGSAWQRPPPPGMVAQRPLQQSMPDVHALRRPCRTRAGDRFPCPSGPLRPAARSSDRSSRPPRRRSPPQAGSRPARAGRRPPCRPRRSTPAPSRKLRPPPRRPPRRTPPRRNPGLQQAPARLQTCPSLEQPRAPTHLRLSDPAGSGAHWNEQQSPGEAHPAPSGRQATGAQTPPAQLPEQQSPEAAHAAPLGAQWPPARAEGASARPPAGSPRRTRARRVSAPARAAASAPHLSGGAPSPATRRAFAADSFEGTLRGSASPGRAPAPPRRPARRSPSRRAALLRAAPPVARPPAHARSRPGGGPRPRRRSSCAAAYSAFWRIAAGAPLRSSARYARMASSERPAWFNASA